MGDTVSYRPHDAAVEETVWLLVVGQSLLEEA